ncbi:MAG: hypothetical protein RIE08_09190 [Acidimicrobiales bacterium]
MAYRSSVALTRWLGDRRAAIDTVAIAHAATGEVDGPGRPLEIGRPLAHAYILRVVAEFQAFARDLHDLAAEKSVEMAGVTTGYQALLVTAATEGRSIDRSNADLRSLTNDFRRLGLTGLKGKLATRDRFWETTASRRGDAARYADLIQLRNCLAHGNQTQLDLLRHAGVTDTVTWCRNRLPGLDRTARALDRVVWEHLKATFSREPW